MKTQKYRFIKNRKNYLKFFLGEASEKEKDQVFNSPEFISVLESEWDAKPNRTLKEESLDKEKIYQKVIEGIEKKSPRVISISFFRKYAAIFFLSILTAGVAAYLGFSGKLTGENSQIVQIYQESGVSEEIGLPDGSSVVLNSNTRIRYPARFKGKKRFVELEGEAYFDVASHRTKAFVVKTSDLEVEVLGTRFNVHAYPFDNFSETVLLSGKVRISRLNPKSGKVQRVVLSPDHKARFLKDEERFVLDKVYAESETSWINGTLSIENETLENLISLLEKKYKVDILLGDENAGTYRINMKIDNEPLEEILVIIKKTLPVDYTLNGKQVILHSREE